MAIQNVPAFPLRSQGLAQQAYSAGVEASLSALPKFIDDMNAVGSAYALTTNGTSTTSVAIGTGSKSFTTQTNLGYLVGMTLRLAFDSTNYMTGDVTSYNTGSGALVVNVTSIVGSGTRTSWVITMAAVGANNASSVSFTPAGNISATNVQAMGEELDAEKISNANGAVTNANLADIVTGATVGSEAAIPVVTYNSKGRITGTTTAPKITSRTAIATTSGTTHDFTSIPSWVKKITVIFNGVSLSGTDSILVQLIVGTPVTSGYTSTSIRVSNASTTAGGSSTSGFNISINVGADALHGHLNLTLLSSNIWTSSHVGRYSTSATVFGGGSVDAGGTLTGIRLAASGSNTFDAGSFNIIYE
jgi:hypothetical protein